MTSDFPVAPVRHEAVAQHQVGRNRPEQLLVDPELVHVDEFQPVALRQLRARGPPPRSSPPGSGRGGWVAVAIASIYPPTTELSSNSGMYSASTTAAMTTPMMTSITGSISVMNRATSVSISSS